MSLMAMHLIHAISWELAPGPRQSRHSSAFYHLPCALPVGIHVALIGSRLPRQDFGGQPARVGGRHAAHHAVLLHQLGQVEVCDWNIGIRLWEWDDM